MERALHHPGGMRRLRWRLPGIVGVIPEGAPSTADARGHGAQRCRTPVASATEGQVVAGWAVAPDGRQIQVHLGGVHAGDVPASTADIVSSLLADGSGSLNFDAVANLVGGPEALEAGKVGARWIPSGAGRADVELRRASP